MNYFLYVHTIFVYFWRYMLLQHHLTLSCYEIIEKNNQTFNLIVGHPYLWARLDRKPNKQAEKKFKQFMYSAEHSKGMGFF